MKKVYVGCALVSKGYEHNYLGSIKGLLKELQGAGFEILEFKSFVDPKVTIPEEIYRHDIQHCVAKADCMLAVCDHFSTGLGYEMGTAIEKYGIPVLAVAHENAMVSKLIQGVIHPKFKFVRYKNWDDIPKMFTDFISEIIL